MIIMNTFKTKIGSSGKRNRAARRRMERRAAFHNSKKFDLGEEIYAESGVIEIVPSTMETEALDLSTIWNEETARKALAMFANSGKSQRAFAAEHSFPESRLRSWKKKLETQAA